jgi:hypothetical protein
VGERPHTQHKNKHRTADRCSRHNDTTVLWFFQYDIGYAWKDFLPQELLQNLNKFAQCELPSAFSVLASMKIKNTGCSGILVQWHADVIPWPSHKLWIRIPKIIMKCKNPAANLILPGNLLIILLRRA